MIEMSNSYIIHFKEKKKKKSKRKKEETAQKLMPVQIL